MLLGQQIKATLKCRAFCVSGTTEPEVKAGKIDPVLQPPITSD